MADVKLTANELVYINNCEIDKKGRLVGMPPKAMPSLYKKGVFIKGDEGTHVARQFRDMFYIAGTVEQKAEQEPEPESEPEPIADQEPEPEPEPEQAEDLEMIEVEPITYARNTKGDDEVKAAIATALREFDAWKSKPASGKRVACEPKVNGRRRWHYQLAAIICNVFGVGTMYGLKPGIRVIFTGDEAAVRSASSLYVFLFKIGNRNAQRTYDEALAKTGSAVGVYASAAADFIAEVSYAFGKEEAC